MNKYGKKYLLQIPIKNLGSQIYNYLKHFDGKEKKFLKSFKRIAKEEEKPELLMEFSNAIYSIHRSFNDTIISAIEYAVELKSLEACESMIWINYYRYGGDLEKVKYYVEKEFKCGYFKKGWILGSFYESSGNLEEALKCYKIAADHGDSNSMLLMGKIFLEDINNKESIQK